LHQRALKPRVDSIFNIRSGQDFKQRALDVFNYQSENNEIYKKYIRTLKIESHNVKELYQIPFLPIEFFKTHRIISIDPDRSLNFDGEEVFTSSGTTGNTQSKHYVTDISVYRESYTRAFEHFYGNIDQYCFLALLPSYLERSGSSLVFMADDLIKKSGQPDSGFYLNNYDELLKKLAELKSKKQKTILLGVSYALLDLAAILTSPLQFEELIVMETGGMKGKRKEMLREELHQILCKQLGTENIHSEYGMTELLSQAYSKGNGIFQCPPWMHVMTRDTNDPFTFLPENKTGAINIIDLANINSCSFIATQDLGRHFQNSFEVLGRFDNSDIRGCNLLVQ